MKKYLLVLALAAFFPLLTSCYDDSEVWNAIEAVNNRIAALEKKVADNVTAIQSMISLGSVSSWEIDAETGKGVITLVGGKSITIDQTVNGYSLITVVKGDDGVWYWAVCTDGVSTPLEVEGKKVPVTVTPDLKISEDRKWLISVDGGKTWVDTDIEYVAGSDSSEDGQVVFFKDVQKEGNHLILTLADGTQVKVAVVGEASITVSAESMWFSRASMEKSVALEMVGVRQFTVTEKPEGWKARIEDSYLYVVSPDDFEDYPKSGEVKILALFEGGMSPEIVSVTVAHEAMFSLSRQDESVSVTMSEHTGGDFNGYVVKGWKRSEYTVEKAVDWLNENAAYLVSYEGDASYKISDLVDEYSDDEAYMIFAAPYLPAMQVLQGKMKYEVSDIQTVSYKKSLWAVSDIRYDSAVLTAGIDAENGYYGGVMELSVWDSYGRDNILEMLSYGGGVLFHEASYSGPAVAFPSGESELEMIPATEYIAWYIPFKDSGAYTDDDIFTYSFKTSDIESDVAVAAPEYLVKDITVTGFSADVTPSAGAYKTYAMAVKDAALPETDDELVRYLIKNGSVSEGMQTNSFTVSSFSSEDNVYLVAVSVTEDGHYGAVSKEKVDINPLVFVDDIGVEVAGIEYGLGDVTIQLSFTGNPSSITYMAATYTYYGDETLQRLMALKQMGDAVTADVASLDGKVYIDGLLNGAEHTFYAVVRNEDENASALYKYKFTPSVSVDYILKDKADYEYGMPQMGGYWSSSDTYVLNVSKPASCRKFWLFKGNSEYFTTDVYSNSDKLITKQLMGTTVHEDSIAGMVFSPMNNTSRFYMVWQDDKDRFHQIYEYKPAK